ncbi:MAG: enoyl-CoA hydratase/isomerase family protein [Saprospiraceae bacterium]|nr:enoyl-CoA hydratase/isomerase family protein [Saprospiraceae bacterium]
MEFIKISEKKDFAVVTLDRGKVNAINHQMVVELRQVVKMLAERTEIRGLIITGKPDYFSAGLDIVELYEYDYTQIKDFWHQFLRMMIDLVKFPKPSIAAISGHSPAGGAIIALTCDHRIMAEGSKYLIGLNEVAVGISIAKSIFDLYAFWLGSRVAYQALMTGKLFNIIEAREIGLIDEIVPLENLQSHVENMMKVQLMPNDYILQTTKKVMRQDLIRKIDVDLSAEIDERCAFWMSPESRKSLKFFVEKITQRK